MLVALSDVVRAIAVVTGRPARQALALGDLDDIGDAIGDHGRELLRLRAVRQRALVLDQPPGDLAAAPARPVHASSASCPALLRRADAGDAHVEEKGLAVAVHTRRLDDPAAAFERLLPPMRELAAAPRPGRSSRVAT